MALASLPAMRARSRPGMAMAATMPIMAMPPKSPKIATIAIATARFESCATSVALVRRHRRGRTSREQEHDARARQVVEDQRRDDRAERERQQPDAALDQLADAAERLEQEQAGRGQRVEDTDEDEQAAERRRGRRAPSCVSGSIAATDDQQQHAAARDRAARRGRSGCRAGSTPKGRLKAGGGGGDPAGGKVTAAPTRAAGRCPGTAARSSDGAVHVSSRLYARTTPVSSTQKRRLPVTPGLDGDAQ